MRPRRGSRCLAVEAQLASFSRDASASRSYQAQLTDLLWRCGPPGLWDARTRSLPAPAKHLGGGLASIGQARYHCVAPWRSAIMMYVAGFAE